MALKFRCKNCGKDIAVRYLTVGEAAECRNCGASNAVPESAEAVSDEAAKSMIQIPASQPAESTSNGPAKSLLIVKMLRIIGIVSIGFGVIVGIIMLILYGNPSSSASFDPQAEWALSGIILALGLAFFYCTPGVLCLGLAKVLELLSK